VRTVCRIADSNRAQTFKRHRSLHEVLFVGRRVWLRVTKRALPGEAPAHSIFKLVSQGGIHKFSRTEGTRRLNHSIFLPQNYGSPFNDTAGHISGLGLAQIDFERFAVAGEVIYSVECDSTLISRQDEEARIATLAHALKKLGNR